MKPILGENIINKKLNLRFNKLLKNLDIKDKIIEEEDFFNKLILPSYSDSLRYYHNIHHIHNCLKQLDKFPCSTFSSNKLFIELALWFHDIVIIEKNEFDADSEFYSCVFFNGFANKCRLSTCCISKVSRYISLTKHDTILGLNKDEKILLDIDLSILGSNKSLYERYSDEIKCEYNYLPDKEYYTGRVKFLQNMLGRNRIFLTDHFYNKYEKKARINIINELSEITLCELGLEK